jgi:hypothetical protein|nr:hypothetical protein [uncultured Capnocytophaga sp.]
MNIFWNIYKNIERELIEISNIIHIDDNQLSVYSPKITELLIRTVVEVEAISKELYFKNGGDKANDNQLFFDTDCIDFLDNKWLLSKKKVIVSAPNFYFSDEDNRVLTPLKKANKRGSSSSKWLIAYQAVKHNRNNSLSKGNLKNLIGALAGLYVLNIYYKDLEFLLGRDYNGTNFDSSLGSSLFSVKVHTNEHVEFSVDNRLYKKNINYDECIYIIEPTQKAKNIFLDFAQKYFEEILQRKLETLDRILISRKENMTDEEIISITEEIRDDKSIEQKILKENVSSLSKIYNDMTYQAVINKQQF